MTNLASKLWAERSFFDDLALLFQQRKVAWQLYKANIIERRRKSGLVVLMPFIFILTHVLVLGVVMSVVFKSTLKEFLPFFAISFALWHSFLTSVNLSASAVDRAKKYIQFPNLSAYLVYLVIFIEYVLALLLNILGALIIIAFINPSLLLKVNYLAMVVGIFFFSLLIFSWSQFLGYFFARYRILKALLPQVLYMIFVITPVLWPVKHVKDHLWIALINPVYHIIELIRAPVLEGTWPLLSIGIIVALIIVGWFLSSFISKAQRYLMIFGWVS